jgi:hypothetical protein
MYDAFVMSYLEGFRLEKLICREFMCVAEVWRSEERSFTRLRDKFV